MQTHASGPMAPVPTGSPATESQQRNHAWWPWAVAIILVVVNLFWTGGLALSHDKALNDRLNYYLTARTLAEGGGLAVPAKSDLRVPDQTPPYAVGERPLFPFLASLAIRIAGPKVQAANFVSALMRALTLLPLFALALRLFGRWTAVGAAVLYTLSPPWTGLGSTSMTGTTFAFFYFLTILLAVAYWQRPSRLFALLTGASFALVVMSREEGLLLGLGLIVILLWKARREPAPEAQDARSESQSIPARGRTALRQLRLDHIALFVLGPLLGYIGQKLYLWNTFGSLSSAAHPLFFNSQYEFLYALRLQTRGEYLASIGGVGGAIAARIFNHLSQLRALFADGLLIDTGAAGLFPLTFLLPLGASLWAVARDAWAGKPKARLIALLTLIIAMQALAWPSFLGRWRMAEIRHVQVITPFLMMLAAEGLVRLWNKRTLVWRAVVVLLAVQFIVMALMYQTLLVDILAVAPPDNTTDIQVLRQAEPLLAEDAILMSRKPNRAARYTGQPAVMMPLAGFKDLMAYAQAHGVTHLLVSRREWETRPGLREGVETMSDSIRPLVQVGNVFIYEIEDYGFLPSIAEGGLLDQEIDMAAPAPPPHLAALVGRASPSTASQVWLTWQKWLEKGP